jgi:hypothetical protein
MSVYRSTHDEFRPLGLNTRTINALIDQQVFTLQDLAQLTEREVARFPSIGIAALKQLSAYLRQEGPSVAIHDRPRVVSIEFPPGLLTAIDVWTVCQPNIQSRAAAVRRLVEMGLEWAAAPEESVLKPQSRPRKK